MSTLPQILKSPPTTAKDAVIWLREAARWLGPGFHPDTPAGEYVNEHGFSFNNEQVWRLNRGLDACFDLLAAQGRTPYSVAIKVQRRMLGVPISDSTETPLA